MVFRLVGGSRMPRQRARLDRRAQRTSVQLRHCVSTRGDGDSAALVNARPKKCPVQTCRLSDNPPRRPNLGPARFPCRLCRATTRCNSQGPPQDVLESMVVGPLGSRLSSDRGALNAPVRLRRSVQPRKAAESRGIRDFWLRVALSCCTLALGSSHVSSERSARRTLSVTTRVPPSTRRATDS